MAVADRSKHQQKIIKNYYENREAISLQDKSRAEKTKREAEAREHPITKHVLQTFGASIKEIKTDV